MYDRLVSRPCYPSHRKDMNGTGKAKAAYTVLLSLCLLSGSLLNQAHCQAVTSVLQAAPPPPAPAAPAPPPSSPAAPAAPAPPEAPAAPAEPPSPSPSAAVAATAGLAHPSTTVDTLPAAYCTPLTKRPFVFFHARKTGGTSLRQEIYLAAQKNNWTSSIGCITSSCHAHQERRDWRHQILAGHFTWSHVFSSIPYRLARPNISCIAVFRHPLERIRSCYYYTWPSVLTWSELTPDQIRIVLTKTRSQHGEGCVNEPLRTFSGFQHEEDLMQLYLKPQHFQDELVDMSRRHLAQCVVLMQQDLKRPITSLFLKYWVPWLNHTKIYTNATPSKPQQELLSAEQEAVVREVAAPEFALWDAAVEQYKRQVLHLSRMTRAERTTCVP